MKRTTFGVVIRDIEGSFQGQLTAALSLAAREAEVRLVFFPGRGLWAQREYELQFNILYRMARECALDGLIVSASTVGVDGDPKHVRALLADLVTRMPTVALGSNHGIDCPLILPDNGRGMRALIDHMVEQHGCARFGYIHGPQGHPDETSRYVAMKAGLRRHGLSILPEHEGWGEFSRSQCRRAVQELLPRARELDVLVAANDDMAAAAVGVLTGAGFHIPRDIKVVGYDDTFGTGQLSYPITSVGQNVLGQARAAIGVLLGRGETQHHRMYPVQPQLAVYATCGCGYHLLLEAGKGTDLPEWATVFEPVLAMQAADPEIPDDAFLDGFGEFGTLCLERGISQGALLQMLVRLSTTALTSAPETQTRINRRLVTATALVGKLKRGRTLQQEPASNLDTWTFGGLLQEGVAGHRQADLRDALLHAFNRVGVRTAFVVLFTTVGKLDDEKRHSLPPSSRMVFAMMEGAMVEAPEFVFPTRELLPPPLTSALKGVSYVVQPLFSQTNHYGYCVLERDHPWSVSVEELREGVSSVVCGRLIISELERARDRLRHDLDQALYDRQVLSSQVNQDELTGLLNRRGLLRELLPASAGRQQNTLLMIDLDDLKAINDQHGHNQGDIAIREFATILRETIKQDGYCARLGGDEFVATTATQDRARIEAIKAELRARTDAFNARQQHPWTLAYSLGSATLAAPTLDDIMDALRTADDLLYQEKAERKRTRVGAERRTHESRN